MLEVSLRELEGSVVELGAQLTLKRLRLFHLVKITCAPHHEELSIRTHLRAKSGARVLTGRSLTSHYRTFIVNPAQTKSIIGRCVYISVTIIAVRYLL